MNTTHHNPLRSDPYFRPIYSRWGAICLVLLVVMQLIVASSTIWLVYLMRALESGHNIWNFLLLYFASLTLPYFPGIAAIIVMSRWQMETIKKFVAQFVATHRDKVSLWNSKKEKEERISLLSGEGQQTYNQFIEYCHRFFACTLNVTLNLLVLSFIVEWKYLLSYLASLLSAWLLLRIFNPKQSHIAFQAQEARVQMGRSLLQSWDNILLGNVYSFSLWKGIFESRFEEASQKTVYSVRYKQMLSLILTLITLLPSFGVVAYTIYQQQGNIVALSALVVTLPRLFMILGFTFEVLELFSEWPMQKAKIKGLSHFAELVEPDLTKRIQPLQLHIQQNENILDNGNLSTLLNLGSNVGRVTIRGANGSGKSSLLLLLKQKWGENSFYLPSENHLAFDCHETLGSTGQSLKRRLEEVGEKIAASVLLLDEWDANLDPVNQKEISNLIDKLSESKCIIEVRHRE